MKKAATILALAFLFGMASSGHAQNVRTMEERPPVVGVKIGDDPDTPTVHMRLEYQLRILANYNPGRMTVHTVFPGGPATKLVHGPNRTPARLEPGDVITHVDGRRINSMSDYYHAMYLSGGRNGKVKLRVVDVNSGNAVEFEARAERVGGGRARVKPLGDSKRATKVKVLLIGATSDPAIGPGVSENLKILRQYATGLPNFDEKADLVEVSGKNLTSAKIMQAVENLDVEPTEALLCYVACHGAHDENIAQGDPSGGHFFQVNDGHLTRRSLFGALADRGGQLTVLITDTCNAPSRYVPPRVEGIEPKPIESKLLTELLYGYEGVVDVSGSSKGQYGWYSTRGGLFTMSMMTTLRQMETERSADWKKLLDKTASTSSEVFQAMKKATLARPVPTDKAERDAREKMEAQTDQRPQMFQVVVKPVQK